MAICCTSCTLKSKTELYLERDLDILSNKKEVNFSLIEDVVIREVGIIRDRSKNNKTIVIKFDNAVTNQTLSNYRIRLKAKIRDENDSIRKPNWNIEPSSIREVNGNKFLLKEVKVQEDKIQRLTISLHQETGNNIKRVGNVLVLRNLYTYND